MFGKLKKELLDLKDHKAHMAYQPNDPASREEHFEVLCKLAARSNAGFKLTGDHSLFTIAKRTNRALILFLTGLILCVSTALLFQNTASLIYWAVELLLIFIALVVLYYAPIVNAIHVDCMSREIRLCSKGLIGKRWIKTETIAFKDFERLGFEEKSTRGGGMTASYHWIFIHFRGKRRFFLELPNGPFYFVNHRVFITCFTEIICLV